jgi:hypothetical protein
MDCVLVQDNRAHQIWRDTQAASLTHQFAPPVVAAMVDVATSGVVQVGDHFDGEVFYGLSAVVTDADGMFADSTGDVVVGYQLLDPGVGYSVVGVSRTPDPRVERWNGSAIVDKSPEVIAALERSEQFTILRTERTALLAASDWMQIPNSPLSAARVSAWATYRQALRDLPATTDDPAQVVWPTPPS